MLVISYCVVLFVSVSINRNVIIHGNNNSNIQHICIVKLYYDVLQRTELLRLNNCLRNRNNNMYLA